MNSTPAPPIRVRVPASSANLGPGFDCLGLALQLYNHVSISASNSGQHQITATGEGSESLGDIESNIAFIAVQHLCKYLQVDFGPIHLHLENEIPFARGLGSSSAARVGALVAANEWAKRHFGKSATREELLDLANELEGHPDNVAAAILGGLTVSTSVFYPSQKCDCCDTWSKERTVARAQRFPVKEWPQFVVFIPDEPLETKVARGVLPETVSRADAIYNLSHTAMLLTSLANGDWERLRANLHDKLHQPYRIPLIRAFSYVLAGALRTGASNVTISGAGPTILVWLKPETDVSQVLAAIENHTKEKNIAGRALQLQVDTQGCIVVSG